MRRTAALAVAVGLVVAGLMGLAEAAAPSAQPPTGMFDLYKQNRTQGVPNYVTEDFLLQSFNLAMEEALTEAEEGYLLPRLKKLVDGLAEALIKVEPPDEATKANLSFLSVLKVLLGGEPLKGAEEKVVAEELARIKAADKLERSNLARQTVDYSQFKVRGKYTRSENLGRYFQAVRYASTILFPLVASQATGVTAEEADLLTRQALGLAKLTWGTSGLKAAWEELDNPLAFLFGPADDLTLADYAAAASWEGETAQTRAKLLKQAQEQGKQPAILGQAVETSKLETGVSAADAVTGLRFLPSRFSPDAAAFQELVWDRVKLYQGKKKPFSLTVIQGKPVKGLPLGLELVDLLGSGRAGKLLAGADETNYAGYKEAKAKAAKMLDRPGGLNAEALKLLQAHLAVKGPAKPADEDRRLKSALGFWTGQRHLSLLYAKQSYTAVGKGMSLDPKRAQAYLEPLPELYAGLAALTEKAAAILDQDRLKKLTKVFQDCQAIAAKEVKGEPLGEAEINFLNEIDAQLFHLVGRMDKPLVVDVHTDPSSGMVVEEGLGYPLAATKKLGQVQARGALFSYYEFKWPLSDRLTDEAWAALLADPAKLAGLKLSPGSMTGARKAAEPQPKHRKDSGKSGAGLEVEQPQTQPETKPAAKEEAKPTAKEKTKAAVKPEVKTEEKPPARTREY